ncbi:MAG: helix-turn-helix transcriptional regulator [Bacilli bacterium]|nr:helix-turn-helix transcriptional regulator [Bacilli bacterium]
MENLRIIREKRNINQVKIAVDLEISQESISKYETGKAFPSKDILIKLANYLNCSVDYLLGRTDNPTVNREKKSNNDENIENLIFRYKRLSDENKNKLEGCLLALEQEQK